MSREEGEHALRSMALGAAVVGVVHDIRNPLNAILLRLELLRGELEEAPSAASHLSALREQVDRVREVVRRLADATEPPAPFGGADLATLLADVAALFVYEARRRRVEIPVVPPAAPVLAGGEPARVARLVFGLYGAALAATPAGGCLAARAEARAGQAVLELDRSPGDPGADLGYEAGVLGAGASALGGGLERSVAAPGVERLTLRLPGARGA